MGGLDLGLDRVGVRSGLVWVGTRAGVRSGIEGFGGQSKLEAGMVRWSGRVCVGHDCDNVVTMWMSKHWL